MPSQEHAARAARASAGEAHPDKQHVLGVGGGAFPMIWFRDIAVAVMMLGAVAMVSAIVVEDYLREKNAQKRREK